MLANGMGDGRRVFVLVQAESDGVSGMVLQGS